MAISPIAIQLVARGGDAVRAAFEDVGRVAQDMAQQVKGAGTDAATGFDAAKQAASDATQTIKDTGDTAQSAGSQVSAAANDTKAALDAVGSAADDAGQHVKTAAEESKEGMMDARQATLDFREAMEALGAVEIGRKVLEFGHEFAEETNKIQDAGAQLSTIAGEAAPELKEFAEHLAESGHFAESLSLEHAASQFALLGMNAEQNKAALEGVATSARLTGNSVESTAQGLTRIQESGDLSALALRRLGLNFSDAQIEAIKAQQALDPLNSKSIALSAVLKALSDRHVDMVNSQSAGTRAANDLSLAWEKLHEDGHGFSIVFAEIDKALTFTVDEFDALATHAPMFGTLAAAVAVLGSAVVVVGGSIIFAGKALESWNMLTAASRAYAEAKRAETEKGTVSTNVNSAAQNANAAATANAAAQADANAAAQKIQADEEENAAAAASTGASAQGALAEEEEAAGAAATTAAGQIDALKVSEQEAGAAGATSFGAVAGQIGMVAAAAFGAYEIIHSIAPKIMDIGTAWDYVKAKLGDRHDLDARGHNDDLKKALDAIDEDAGNKGVASDDPRVSQAKAKVYREFAAQAQAAHLGKEAAEDLEHANQMDEQVKASKAMANSDADIAIPPMAPPVAAAAASPIATDTAITTSSGPSPDTTAASNRVSDLQEQLQNKGLTKAARQDLQYQLFEARKAETSAKAADRDRKAAERAVAKDKRTDASMDVSDLEADASDKRADVEDSGKEEDFEDERVEKRKERAIHQQEKQGLLDSESAQNELTGLKAVYDERKKYRQADLDLQIAEIEAQAKLAEASAQASSLSGEEAKKALKRGQDAADRIRRAAQAKANMEREEAQDDEEDAKDSNTDTRNIFDRIRAGASAFDIIKASNKKHLIGADDHADIQHSMGSPLQVYGGTQRQEYMVGEPEYGQTPNGDATIKFPELVIKRGGGSTAR